MAARPMSPLEDPRAHSIASLVTQARAVREARHVLVTRLRKSVFCGSATRQRD
jgi:hypothetical protein